MDETPNICELLDNIERTIFLRKLAEIEATKFIGEDGKEYFRFPTRNPFPKHSDEIL